MRRDRERRGGRVRITLCALAAGVLGAWCAGAQGEVVRSAANGRVWQVNLAPDEPLRWPWTTGATSARLVVSNVCAQTVSEAAVARQTDELFGAFPLTVAPAPSEQLFDLVLTQFLDDGSDGARALSVDRARIVYLPGIHGNGIDVCASRRLRTSESVVVFPYDRAWASATGAATAASVSWTSGGESGSRALAGTSGFDALPLERLCKTRLTLAFDGSPCWKALVRFGAPGTLLMIR